MRLRPRHGGLLAVALLSCIPAARAEAQQPKLDIKVLGGFSYTLLDSLVPPQPDVIDKERYGGFQFGFGARLSRRKAFGEVLLTFNRVVIPPAANSPDQRRLRVNSFEIPINLGYVPYRISKFGLYLYGGYVNRFNIAIRRGRGSDKTKVDVRQIFNIYQALVRFGVNFDLYMFNIDFNYSIGLNSATDTDWRTRYQAIQLSLAYVF